MHNNGISEIMNMERPDMLPAVHSLLPHFLPTTASVERRLFFHAGKTDSQGWKISIENV